MKCRFFPLLRTLLSDLLKYFPHFYFHEERRTKYIKISKIFPHIKIRESVVTKICVAVMRYVGTGNPVHVAVHHTLISKNISC